MRVYICMHIQLGARPASTPPFSEGSKFLNSVRASDFAWLPPAVHSNCSERLWLHARTFLVALENRVRWPGESNWRRTPSLFPFSTYASIVAAKTRIQRCLQLPMKFGNIVRVETSRYLTRSRHCRHGEGSCSQAYGFATITMYSWWQPSEIGCAYRI